MNTAAMGAPMERTCPTAYWMTQKDLLQVVGSCLPSTCLLLRLNVLGCPQ